jgi:hypothetical protein
MPIVFPFTKPAAPRHLQHPREHSPMRFEIDQPPRARNRRVVGRRFVQRDAEKITQGQRIRRAPRDAALRVNAFEVADQQQPEINARRQAGPAHRLGVTPGALALGELVEPMLAQQLIQAPVEWMTRSRRQIRRRDPHRRLPIAFAFAHRHAAYCSTPNRRRDNLSVCGGVQLPVTDR